MLATHDNNLPQERDVHHVGDTLVTNSAHGNQSSHWNVDGIEQTGFIGLDNTMHNHYGTEMGVEHLMDPWTVPAIDKILKQGPSTQYGLSRTSNANYRSSSDQLVPGDSFPRGYMSAESGDFRTEPVHEVCCYPKDLPSLVPMKETPCPLTSPPAVLQLGQVNNMADMLKDLASLSFHALYHSDSRETRVNSVSEVWNATCTKMLQTIDEAVVKTILYSPDKVIDLTSVHAVWNPLFKTCGTRATFNARKLQLVLEHAKGQRTATFPELLSVLGIVDRFVAEMPWQSRQPMDITYIGIYLQTVRDVIRYYGSYESGRFSNAFLIKSLGEVSYTDMKAASEEDLKRYFSLILHLRPYVEFYADCSEAGLKTVFEAVFHLLLTRKKHNAYDHGKGLVYKLLEKLFLYHWKTPEAMSSYLDIMRSTFIQCIGSDEDEAAKDSENLLMNILAQSLWIADKYHRLDSFASGLLEWLEPFTEKEHPKHPMLFVILGGLHHFLGRRREAHDRVRLAKEQWLGMADVYQRYTAVSTQLTTDETEKHLPAYYELRIILFDPAVGFFD